MQSALRLSQIRILIELTSFFRQVPLVLQLALDLADCLLSRLVRIRLWSDQLLFDSTDHQVGSNR